MPRKTRANRTPFLSSESSSKSELFKNARCREMFEKLNCKRKIWAEHFVVLDDVDPAIRENFESKGWLSLLKVDHPPPTTVIREFFSNLSCHIYDFNTLVRSWIRGVKFTITPRIVAEVAEALGVLVVWQPILMRSLHPLMMLCHTSLGLLSSEILILESRPLSLLRLLIFSL